MNNEIMLFTDDELELEVNFSPEQETVWPSLDQIVKLFDRGQIGHFQTYSKYF